MMNGITALLVEDDDTDALLFEHQVAGARGQHLRLERVDRLSAAVDRSRLGGLDVVLLDLGLPDSQGLETFRRFHDQVPEIPVVVLTGSSDDEQAIAAIEAGAQDYLVKGELGHQPVGRLLQYAVERHRLQDRVRAGQQEMIASQARFRELVELADDALYRVSVGPDWQVDYVSPGIAASTGIAATDFHAEPGLWHDRIHPGDRARWQDLSRLEQGGSDRLVVRWRLPDDSWAWLEDRRTPIVEDGRLVAIQGILRDVSVRERTDQALRDALAQEREAVERLRAVDRMKGTFLQAVSHELRTPLTVIRGFALTLSRHGGTLSDAERSSLYGRLEQASERLERLLVDLLDVDRLDRGVVPVDRAPTRLRDVVDHVLATVAPGDHVVEVACDPGLVAWLDAAKVERILENLLQNACKHTPAGTMVRVLVAPGAGGVVLTVEDEGPGIPTELATRVFEPFAQGDASSTEASPGTGIGLALVAGFAELHGGCARVESTGAGGARFVVELPATPADGTRAGSVPPSAAADGRTHRVDAASVVLDTVRQLLHATTAEEVPEILVAAVDQLGGGTTVDELDGVAALPLDLSMGVGRPVVATAPPGSPTRVMLEAHLPRLVEDAREAVHRCRRLAASRRDPALPPGFEQRVALRDLLDDLTEGDAILRIRFVHAGGGATPDRTTTAAITRSCVRAVDRAFVSGGGEFSVVMLAARPDVVARVVDRLDRATREVLPDVDVQVEASYVAAVDGGGAAFRRPSSMGLTTGSSA